MRETAKQNQLDPGQESMGDSTVLSHCFAKKSLAKTDRCAGALSFFWTFPNDCIRKATKAVQVHLFIYSNNCVNCTSEFRELLEATTYKY